VALTSFSGRLFEIHITGDIAFAARQYIAATGNQEWLLNELGGELIYETARFWVSRAVYNNETKQYEILSKSLCWNKTISYCILFSVRRFTTR
jgi:trehalose/maltose hydrolase-like predicted phosphorylase